MHAIDGKFSSRRAITCAIAWALATATLLAAIYTTVRFTPYLADHFDWPILLKLNRYVLPVAFLNSALTYLVEIPILTGVPLIGLVWYLWFATKSESAKARILLGLGGAIAAVTLSRVLQLSLPTHLRPVLVPVPGFNVPPGADLTDLHRWNSVPSDHACVYFALVTVIWRRLHMLGLFSLLPALIGNLPRIYLGYHYPSDLVLGALLGIFIVCLVENYGPETLACRVARFELRRPGVFYALGFLLTYEVATLFGDIRQIAALLVHAYRLLAF
jgi:undecaprenyl-diphosphatase